MKTNDFSGVWPTMITPFTGDDKPDFAAIGKMVEWYISMGCDGLFAVCQSSEMFFLSPREKLDIAKCVRDAAGGRAKVIASGHTADSLSDQMREIEAMAGLDLDALVLVSNRLAGSDEGVDVFNANARAIFDAFPETPFGIYECPYPYKRLVTDAFVAESAKTGSLCFLKDTCCDPDILEKRAGIAAGSNLALFNANTATLLDSLRFGYVGYNGVMANYHPDLYAWLVANYRTEPEKAGRLSDLLTVLAISEARCYPVSAKYHFDRGAVPMTLVTRSADASQFNINDRRGFDALAHLEDCAREWLKA